jgi:hypothetical protein
MDSNKAENMALCHAGTTAGENTGILFSSTSMKIA